MATKTYRLLLRYGLLLLLGSLRTGTECFADSTKTKQRTVTKLSEGVYAIRHKDSTDSNPNGNTTVIIGGKEVFVVDSCFLPSVAHEDIAQIRQWTNQPVRYLLNTHWHNDHNVGNGAYAEAFPGLAIVAHAETKREMDLFIPTSPGRFLKYLAQTKQTLDTGKDEKGAPLSDKDRADTQEYYGGLQKVTEELKTLDYRSPTLTYDHQVNFDLGGREVQVKFLGRGNTGGDSVVYLPKEKIVISGDLLVHPIPYFFDGYPSEWIETLHQLALLDADTIVPGHGEILHDKSFLYQVSDMLRSAVRQVTDQLHRIGPAGGHSLEEIQKGVDLSGFREKFGGNDPDNLEAFDEVAAALVRVAVHEASLR